MRTDERKTALSLKDLRKAYNGVVAVDGLSLDVRVGECFGLLGPNGAGKTTTIEVCEGLSSPDSGSVRVLGMTWGADAKSLRQRLGIQLQETQFAEKLTVIETVRLFRSLFRQGLAPEDTIKLVALEQKRNAMVRALSGGQKQRLALACALVGNPEFLFLDEPTTGLDPQSRRQLWDLVDRFKGEGRTILLTTHYMAEAEQLCDRVAIMDRGQVVATGTPDELIATLGVEHILECTVVGDKSSMEAISHSRVDGVGDVHRKNETILIQVKELHRALPALLHVFEERNIALASLQMHSPTLDDVFMAITGRKSNNE